jgi:prolyl oligopeptidase
VSGREALARPQARAPELRETSAGRDPRGARVRARCASRPDSIRKGCAIEDAGLRRAGAVNLAAMRSSILFLLLLTPAAALAQAPAAKLSYPPAPKGPTVDEYHGTKVADPYRWLENPDSPETRAWIEAQNRLTFGFLEKLPQRARFRERLTQIWNFERYVEAPVFRGGRTFFEKNDGLQNQEVLYVIDEPGKPERVLLDPNTLSPDGTVALYQFEPSDDGKRIAYAVSTAGSDWNEWRVRDVATGKDLPDVLRWSKFTRVAWARGGKGFYYGAFDPPKPGEEKTGVNYHQKLFFHQLGAPQAKDALVYERKDQKEWQFDPRLTDDGKYLVMTIERGSDPENQLFVKELGKKKAPVVELVSGFEARATLAGTIGTRFFIHTDKGAPRGRVVAIDLADKTRAWKEVVPEEKATIDEVTLVNDTLIVRYLEDARGRVTLYRPTGEKLGDVKLPGIGTVGGFEGRRGDKETFYTFESFTTPVSLYHFDVTTGESHPFRQPKLPFDASQIDIKQIFYTSKDGTRLPMFVVHPKAMKLDGKNPTFLYGYGGFNIPMTPTFSVTPLAWVEAGGVYVHTNLRGGGEYGKEWHLAGSKHKKQNTFDDFIAAAEHLVAQKVTSPAHIAIGGGSNGGLLVGAVLNQRPDLFAAAVPQVGVMDMLRYHKFTIGWAWVGNYGSSDDPEEFKTIFRYSPLHNIKPGGAYPATLVTTADHDDRVVPAHSFKYAAALQAAQSGAAPILIRIDTRAGHGKGKPTSKKIEEAADRLAFMAHFTGLR